MVYILCVNFGKILLFSSYAIHGVYKKCRPMGLLDGTYVEIPVKLRRRVFYNGFYTVMLISYLGIINK